MEAMVRSPIPKKCNSNFCCARLFPVQIWLVSVAALSSGDPGDWRLSTYGTSHSTPLAGSDWKGQPDLVLIPSCNTKSDGKYTWANIRVTGELKQSEN
jgi:hypothetical protein